MAKIKGVVIMTRKKFEPVVYGLEGIMSLFGVSKTTASLYKNTFLRPAVSQQGNVILTDVKEALRLFGLVNPEGLVREDTKE